MSSFCIDLMSSLVIASGPGDLLFMSLILARSISAEDTRLNYTVSSGILSPLQN